MNFRAGSAVSLPLALALAAAPEAKATASLCDSVAGNLVQNCGFETTGGWAQVSQNDFLPHTGDYSGTTDGGDHTVYTQVIYGLVSGETYNFAAWVMNGINNPTISASIGPSALFTTVTGQVYAEFTSSFVATATSMLLTIGQASGSPGYGTIDDVSIVAASTPVPEPASAALLGLGLAGLAGLRRRR